MKTYFTLCIFLTFFLGNAQFENDYDITLVFDSSKNEMFISDKMSSKYPFKMFLFIRARAKKPVYSFHINKNGRLIKGLLGSTGWGDYTTSLMHNPKKHSKEIKIKINLKNPIKWDDYMDISHKNFRGLLKNARKIYMVDLSEKSIDDLHYNVYEVHYGHYSLEETN